MKILPSVSRITQSLKSPLKKHNTTMDSNLVNVSSLAIPLSQAAAISSLISQVTPLTQADEDNQKYFIGFVCSVIILIIKVHLRFRFKPSKEYSPGVTSSIYIDALILLVESYVSLLFVNWSNIWLAIFPLIAIGFILALCYELSHQRSQQPDDGKGNASSGDDHEGQKDQMKKADEGLDVAALVPYWVLWVMAQFHTADNFAVSHFFLFFSSMLGALTLMMTQLALAGAAPGVAPASVLLRKASLVVLLVTVHAFAAELLGEDVMLFILPELAPVLLWFSLCLNSRDGLYITADKIRARRSVITALGAAVAAVFAFLMFSMDEFVLSWCTNAAVSCGVSGLLVYYVVYMLYQWPGLDSTASSHVEEAAKLLKLWANILLTAAAVFLGAVGLGLHQQMLE